MNIIRYALLLGTLTVAFVSSAERYLTVTVPVKQELTQEAFPSDTYVPTYHICTSSDSTVVAKSKTVFNESDIIGLLETKDENGKFLVHVFVNKMDAEGNLTPSADFQDVWFELDLSKITGKRYRANDVFIPIRKVRKTDE